MRRERTEQTPARRRGLLALVAFACSCAFVVQAPGWAQTSYMALTKAFSEGTPKIDRWHWETHDISYTNGHYYSVKPPGFVLATFPFYEALKAVGAEKLARDASARAEAEARWPLISRTLPPESYGYSAARARFARTAVADDAPMTWALGLIGVLLPALALLHLVARATDRVAPGYGTAAAITLGTATMILPFSTLFFSHALSALLSFAAFALVWRERERDGPQRLWALAAAGLLAGFAIACEYPLAITAIVVGVYALLRRDGRVRRALAYGSGLAAGVAPLLLYNQWAFGSPLKLSYANAVKTTGHSGHDVLGLNDGGVFGITLPRPGDALMLLFSGRGLLTLTPIVAMAIAGVVLMHRDRRHRTEARVIAVLAAAYLVYNAGYWLPLGGGSPGPRFLIPILPFLAMGLGLAWRRWPAVTLAFAAISATTMTVATMSYPMLGTGDAGEWIRRLFDDGFFQHSVLDLTGVAHGFVAILPFVVGVGIALWLGARTLDRAHLATGARYAPLAVGAWVVGATVLPLPGHTPSWGAAVLIAASAATGLLAVAAASFAGRRVPSSKSEEHHAASPLSLEVQTAQRSG